MQVDSGMPTALLGHGASETILHPIVAVAWVVAIAAMLLLPRKYVVIPFLLAMFLTPVGQQLYVSGVHFYVLRILVIVGWIRVAIERIPSKSKMFAGGLNRVDKAFFLWAVFRASSGMLRAGGDPGALITLTAFLMDALGGYFFLRFLIRDKKDIVRVIQTFAVLTIILGAFMVNEKLRMQNVFGLLGGVAITPDVREGSVRAQGPFEHAILAGVFAATLMALFFWLWKSGRSRGVAVAGAIGATAMVICCASSTPLLAYLAFVSGVCFWPFRRKMQFLRWGIVIALVALHLVMKAPVWFLIARVDIVAGNSGYHRAELIDVFVKHFWDWWLIGTDQVVNWGFDMWDMSNQFVAEGETGGLATFICFILMIAWSFGRIGRARKLVKTQREQWFFWCLGVALFSHCVAYFGISYFDQTRVAWYSLLAIISAATAPLLAQKTKRTIPAHSIGVPIPILPESATETVLYSRPTSSEFA